MDLDYANANELGRQLLEWSRAVQSEVGTEGPCPMCGTLRVARTDYIRCQPCGVNWIQGEDRKKDPRVGRYRSLMDGARTTSKASKYAGSSAVDAEPVSPAVR